jgi:hypothetical protein
VKSHHNIVEIVKHETTIQSESLIKRKREPLIWLHFQSFGDRNLECRDPSSQECQNAKRLFGVGYGHRRWLCEGKELA